MVANKDFIFDKWNKISWFFFFSSLMRIFDGLNAVGNYLTNMNVNDTMAAMEANIIQSQLYQYHLILQFSIKQLQYFNGKYTKKPVKNYLHKQIDWLFNDNLISISAILWYFKQIIFSWVLMNLTVKQCSFINYCSLYLKICLSKKLLNE